jgi:hypothetical protein
MQQSMSAKEIHLVKTLYLFCLVTSGVLFDLLGQMVSALKSDLLEIQMIELLKQEVKRFSTPSKGALIYATPLNMTEKNGSVIGTVKKVNGGIVTFFDGEGHQHIIWRFPNGQRNEWIEFGA